VHKISELEPDDYPELINLADPNAEENEEFQLNLTNLDDTTILNIQKYVLDCLKAKKRKNGQRRKKDYYNPY